MMGLPFMYVRPEPKSHGLENLIEGDPLPGQKVVVIEDLVSTGGSSLKAVEALRRSGCEVLGMVAIFTYRFPRAVESFEKAGCRLLTLSNYDALLELALENGHIRNEILETLQQWRQSPESWSGSPAK
jgi:orotate phosphoribosyltransferase